MTESKNLAGAFALLVLVSGLAACRHGSTSQPESQLTPAAKTTVQAVQPSQSNSTPAVDDCGLTAFPVSMSAKEILAAVPRVPRSRNSTMFAKIEIDPEGKVFC